ncbi:phage tail tape measure protein [uncultured Brevibacillus sp.]|uniref:phage tail tape measure protein n=1 Tax=uncultured Brevibacillus sp. TaxID=169970 RepID=UPI002591D14C|nr:phage tail tape measure protein [uncultured Brevibacillus sp.]
MAETINGITVVIGASTTRLLQALSDVNKKLKDTQSELKQVDDLLKLDPKNTELLAQKSQLLADAIGITSERLQRLQSVQQQVNEQFANGTINEGQYRAFQRELLATEQQLNTLQASVAKTKVDFETIGKSIQDTGGSFKKVTQPIVDFGTSALKAGMEFEASMSEVKAITGATGSDLEALEAKAKEMGKNTKFSATEAAAGLKGLADAGWSSQEMLSGIDGVMTLATASGESLAKASEVVTTSMKEFGLSANQSGQFVDVLAAASSQTHTSVAMLGESFKTVAPVAGALGYSAEDTAIALGLMSNAGIKAGEAGKSLQTALNNMTSPTKEMSAVMDKLGISMTDNQGNMKGLDTVMQDLRSAFGGLDADQQAAYASTLFGKDAMAGMLGIIQASEEDYNNLSLAINNSTGEAKQMADTMQDNAKGGLTELNSAIESVSLQVAEILLPVFRDIVELVTNVVEWFASFDEKTQKIIVGIGVFAAAIGPVLIGLGSLITTVGSIVQAFDTISGVFSKVGTVMSLFSGPVGIAIAAIAALAVAAYLIYENWEPISTFFIDLWNGITSVTTAAWEGIKQFFLDTWTWIQAFFAEWGTVILAVIAPFIGIPLLIQEHWDEIKTYLAALWESISQVATESWNLIVSAIMEIVAPFVELFMGTFTIMSDGLIQIWDGVKLYFEGLWEMIRTIFLDAIQFIYDLVTGILTQLSADAQLIWNALKDAFFMIWDGIKLVFTGALDALISYLNLAWDTVKTTTENVWNQIVAFFTTTWNTIQTITNTVWNGIVAFLTTTWNTIQTIANTVWNGIVAFFSTTWNTIQTTTSTVWNGIVAFFTTTWNTLQTLITTAVSAIVLAIQTKWNEIVTFFTNTWAKIQGLFTNGFDQAKKTVMEGMIKIKDDFLAYMGDVVDGIKDFTEDFIDAGGEFVTGIWDGIRNKAGWLYNQVKGFVSNIVSSISGAIPGGGGGGYPGNRTGDSNMTGAGGGVAKSAAFPGLADGGTVTKSGWTWVGENGPELLSLPQGSQVIPNYDIPKIGAQVIDYDALARAMAAHLKPSITQNNTFQSLLPLTPSETARKNWQVSRQLALEWGL